MIEVKNLKKTYVTKGNVVTKALDDVSITFPEKGLIFLLGKSGSGKSTLLNICGGLDEADSGEIIIMGKSSKKFSSSDFDSYRNTFIGFIFQDYNILNEFSVSENLALALELQGKKASKEKITELLDSVDLSGFEKRKPNTLSGGQKQRIAIARALIKEPKIIMADEPTGALDSKTGKQVFDTLKKLSENHLIIVVSHDREFAEIYGDRIIELKDGQILSDETKTHLDAKVVNENISLIANNTLSIKNAKNLTQKDKDDIINFIANSSDKIIISNSEDDIKSFREVNRIGDDDKTETFKDTTKSDISTREYSKDESKFIKSKLPMPKAIKMGLSSLKVKPVRLMLTMMLTIVAFLLFGVSSALMDYNKATVIKNSFNKSDYESIEILNNYTYTTTYYEDGKAKDSYSSTRQTVFTEEEINNLSSSYGDDVLPIYAISYSYNNVYIANIAADANTPKTLQDTAIAGLSTPLSGSKYETLLYGTMPNASNEIAVSEFFANVLLNSKVTNPTTSTEYTINSLDDVLEKTISIRINDKTINFIVKGIYKGDNLPSKYQNYADLNETNSWSKKKLTEFADYISETPDKVLLITKDGYNNIISETGFDAKNISGNYNKYFVNSKFLEIGLYSDASRWAFYSGVNTIDNASLPITYFSGYSQTSNGIVMRLNDLVYLAAEEGMPTIAWTTEDWNNVLDLYIDSYTAKINRRLAIIKENLNDEQEEYFMSNYYDYFYNSEIANMYSNIEAYAQEYAGVADEIRNSSAYTQSYAKASEDWDKYYGYTNGDYWNDKIHNKYETISNYYQGFIAGNNYSSYLQGLESLNPTEEEYNNLLYYFNILWTAMNKTSVTIKVSEGNTSFTVSRAVIGYYISHNENSVNYGIYTTQSDYDSFIASNYSKDTSEYTLEDSDSYYSSVFVPLRTSKSIFKSIGKENNNHTVYSVNNNLYSQIDTVSSLVGILKKAFFYVGIVLACFSALLLFNFITVSISSKTHEIGVLRAVGARGKDVFKIFFSESLFISLLAFGIALIGAIAIVLYLNGYITTKLGYSMQLLTFGIKSILMMLGIAVAVAIIGTFIPVTLISRKKPVDSLRAN